MRKYLPVIFILLLAVTAFAHTDEIGQGCSDNLFGITCDTIQETKNYQIEAVLTPIEPVVGEQVEISFHVKDIAGTDIEGAEVQIEINRENFVAGENSPAHYSLDYTFTVISANHVYVNIGDEQVRFDVSIKPAPQEAQFDMPWIIFTVIVLIIIWAFFLCPKGKKRGKKKKHKINFKTPLGLSIVFLIVIFLSFSLLAFSTSPAIDGCKIKVGDSYVLHCHQDLEIEICGDVKNFAWETGDLDRGHTHKDNHKIHWHPPSVVDDPAKFMTLSNLFSDLGMELTESSVEDPETKTIHNIADNTCGTNATLKVLINEKQINNFLDHPLEDEDNIRIVYE